MMTEDRVCGAPPLLDPLDVATFANGHPHALYDRWRREAPVDWHPGSASQPGFWMLTRHCDIEAVSRDQANFTSTRGFRLQTDRRAAIAPRIGAALARTVIALDPPEQKGLRAVINPSFMPGNIRRIEALLRDWVRDRFDALAGREQIDFVAEVAAIVPIKTLCLVLGLPEGIEDRVFAWSNAILGSDDPDYASDPEVTTAAYDEMFALAADLVEKRRADPRDDMMTAIAHATVGGAPMDGQQQQALTAILIAAGNETTRNSLSGMALTLARDVVGRAKLVDDHDRLPSGVDEMLRYLSPVYQMMRTATRRVDVGGRTIGPGERVVMLYGAANHDPEVFADPHQVVFDRPNARRHLAFGTGIHHCAGARLATLQIRLIIGELIKRYPLYKLMGMPRFLTGNLVWGIKELQLKLQ